MVHIYQKSNFTRNKVPEFPSYLLPCSTYLKGYLFHLVLIVFMDSSTPYFLEFYVFGLERRYQCDLITHGSTGCWIKGVFGFSS